MSSTANVYARGRLRVPVERTLVITADGLEFDLQDHGGRWILSFSGIGMAPVRYLTQQGPFQDGVTVTDFHLEPRLVDLVLRDAGCTRQEYWDLRAEAINHFRPNRSTDGSVQLARLRKVRPDGTRRDLEVLWQEGLRFEPQGNAEWDRFAWQDPIRLYAPDPTLFDPTEVALQFALATQSQLVFPATFPISFGTGILNVQQVVTYVGTWPTFPIVSVTGPLDNFRLDNDTIGEHVALDYDLPAAQMLEFDLRYGRKTVRNTSTGQSLIGSVTEASDLATFRLEVDPRAPVGQNSLRVTGSSATVATQVAVRYFTRFIGT